MRAAPTQPASDPSFPLSSRHRDCAAWPGTWAAWQALGHSAGCTGPMQSRQLFPPGTSRLVCPSGPPCSQAASWGPLPSSRSETVPRLRSPASLPKGTAQSSGSLAFAEIYEMSPTHSVHHFGDSRLPPAARLWWGVPPVGHTGGFSLALSPVLSPVTGLTAACGRCYPHEAHQTSASPLSLRQGPRGKAQTCSSLAVCGPGWVPACWPLWACCRRQNAGTCCGVDVLSTHRASFQPMVPPSTPAGVWAKALQCHRAHSSHGPQVSPTLP